MLVIDGNDGTGKSTLVRALRALGYTVQDRGAPTRMTDDPSVQASDGEFYVILDVPVEISRSRLERAGKDLNEQYHTVEDLSFYRRRFLEISETLQETLQDRCVLLDSSGTPDEVLQGCLDALGERR